MIVRTRLRHLTGCRLGHATPAPDRHLGPVHDRSSVGLGVAGLPQPAPRLMGFRQGLLHEILGGVPVSRLLPGAGLDDLLLVASTEINTDDDREALAAALEEVL